LISRFVIKFINKKHGIIVNVIDKSEIFFLFVQDRTREFDSKILR
jgi:hypothetical protein